MPHKFTRVPILLGQRSSIEYCIHCGLESQRYKSGGRRWVVDGTIVDNAPECIETITDAHTRYKVPVPVESIMEDATVILKVLYDAALPRFGTGSNPMRMAKTFLESKQLL